MLVHGLTSVAHVLVCGFDAGNSIRFVSILAAEEREKRGCAFVRLAVKFTKEEIRIIVREDSDFYLLSLIDFLRKT